MLNINELEQRWLRYKIKFYIPHAIIIISLIFILIFVLLYLNNTTEQTDTSIVQNIKKIESVIPITQEKTSQAPIVQIEKIYIGENTKPTPSLTDKKMTIAPSLDFIKKMQGNTLSNYEYKSVSIKKEFKKTQVKVEKQPIPRQVAKPKPISKPVQVIKPKNKKISINRQNTHDDISQVVSRFNKNNNPALSLFIAKKYYELGEYHKAYNYALITNEINSEIEASWIIFTKSLVKLNKKEMAIKTLKRYISHSNSNRANILLDDIVSGKFR